MPFSALDSLASFSARSRGGVVAIGNFDGVHRGHQAVVARAKEIAAHAARPCIVLTFEPHPRAFFAPNKPFFRLTPRRLRDEALAALGVDAVVTLPFDHALADLDAEAFVDTVLTRGLGATHVVAGFDFHFGKGRSGTPDTLGELGKSGGFGVDIVPPFRNEAGGAVSSSVVRDALARGDVTAANAALGWRWMVDGTVIHGDKRGRTLGYPTANMALPAETGLAHGVYAVRARVDGSWYGGAANFGRRVQFGGGPVLLETYILDFKGDLYDSPIRVEFCGRLRGEEKFASVADLVDQMGRDVDAAREIVTASLRAPTGPVQAHLGA